MNIKAIVSFVMTATVCATAFAQEPVIEKLKGNVSPMSGKSIWKILSAE